MRSVLLTSKVKALELDRTAPMPSERVRVDLQKERARESIKSWQRLKRMHLVRGERNE